MIIRKLSSIGVFLVTATSATAQPTDETGLFADAGESGAHGLDERIRVRSVMDGRTLRYQLVKAYTGT